MIQAALPFAVDLFCGLGGWTEGLLTEGYRVVGFDIERHQYGPAKYPAQMVLQDVLTIHGSQFKDAALIVASPPCQAYSYRAMPWTRAKALPPPDNSLFDACFRIQREAIAAAGHFIPMVVENVRGAQPWVGRARWHFGSYYLWGDVPVLMPIVTKRRASFREDGAKTPTGNCSEPMWKDRPIARLAHATPEEMERHGFKVPGFRFDGSGKSFQSASVALGEGIKAGDRNKGRATGEHKWTTDFAEAGMKNNGGSWFAIGSPGQKVTGQNPDGRLHAGLKHNARKAASAAIAKIPLALARHIAAAWKPE